MTPRQPEAIILAGNMLVDYVKTVKRMPSTGTLAEILSKERHTGGAPLNVAMNLRDMDSQIPLHCLGCVGRDADGDYIIQELKKREIHCDGIQQLTDATTSYTDVMSSIEEKERTFFHYPGANNRLSPHSLKPALHTPARMFHLGYINLLPGIQNSFKHLAATLDALRAKNVKVSLDMVSGGSSREARESILPVLHHIDYLIINEVELGMLCNQNYRPAGTLDTDKIKLSLREIVHNSHLQIAIVHYPEGSTAFDGRTCLSVPSMKIPKSEIKGKVGAGDAFCAAVLYGLYQGRSLEQSLQLGSAGAISSMRVSGAVGGVPPARELLPGNCYPGTAAR